MSLKYVQNSFTQYHKTMKINKSLLVSLTVLLFIVCSCSTNANEIKPERDDIIGTWKITDASYNALRKLRPNNKITTLMELNADSTVVFYYGKNHDRTTEAQWTFKDEKKRAFDEFGVSLQNDIIINSKKWGFGMLLGNCGGKTILYVKEYAFEKQL